VSNAWRFAGIGCSAWQQQRAKAWTVYREAIEERRQLMAFVREALMLLQEIE
jgi:hypothetical protein